MLKKHDVFFSQSDSLLMYLASTPFSAVTKESALRVLTQIMT